MKTYHYVISELCNMNCTYCNVDVDNKAVLDIEYFKEFYKTISSEYILSLFGGEVFLQLDLVENIIKIVENDSRLKIITITTNATIYNDRVKNIINHNKVKITLSHDGLNQIKNRGDNKLYLKEFYEQGVRNSHNMITGNDVYEGMLIENHQYLNDLNLLPHMTLVRDIGSWTQEQAEIFIKDYKAYTLFIADHISNIKKYKDIPGLILHKLNPILTYHINDFPQSDCECGTEHISISPKGVSPCERFLRDNTVKLENKENCLIECDTCSIKNYCNKGCIYEQIKNKEPIKELCYIYKEMHRITKDFIELTGHATIKLFKEM